MGEGHGCRLRQGSSAVVAEAGESRKWECFASEDHLERCWLELVVWEKWTLLPPPLADL